VKHLTRINLLPKKDLVVLSRLKETFYNEIQLPYFHSSLDTYFDEYSSLYGHCLLLDFFLENLANHIPTFKMGKSKRSFETSACILVKK
jgi:hypothetical protein